MIINDVNALDFIFYFLFSFCTPLLYYLLLLLPLFVLLFYFYLSHAQLYIVQCTVKCILYTCISRKRERKKNTVVKQ